MIEIDTTTSHRSDTLDSLLKLRINVAAYGESDALGWWDSYALGDVGEYALSRLFPRTAPWAALELGCEAARRRQQQLLEGVAGALHLFDLGDQIESLLSTRILSYKVGELAGELPLAMRVRPRSADDLDAALRRLVGDDAIAQARRQTPRAARLVQLASLPGNETVARALRCARTLAAAYIHSDRSRLTVPYLLASPQAAS